MLMLSELFSSNASFVHPKCVPTSLSIDKSPESIDRKGMGRGTRPGFANSIRMSFFTGV